MALLPSELPGSRRMRFSRPVRFWLFLILALLVAGLSAGWMGHHLPWGAWARTDSVAYIEAARHIAQGQGVRVYTEQGDLVWMSHFPPFYPFTLALWMKAGLVWHQATRWNSALAFGLLTGGLFLALALVTRRLPEGLVGAFWLAFMPPLVMYLAGAMSEGWFYVWVLATVFGWWHAIYHHSPRAAFWAGVAAGLGVLTRYAGLFLLGGVVFFALLVRPWRRAVGLSGAFVAPFFFLYGSWQALMRWHGVGLRYRLPPPAVWWRETLDFLRGWPDTVWQEWLWFRGPELQALPPWLYREASYLVLLLPVVVGLWAGWRWWKAVPVAASNELPLPGWAPWQPGMEARLALWSFLLSWTGLGYLLFALLAHLFRDPPAALLGRVLSPFLLLSGGGVLGWGLWLLAQVEKRLTTWKARGLWVAVWGSATLVLFFFVAYVETSGYMEVMRRYGNGYTARIWHRPAFWAKLQAWPQDIALVATEAHAARLWTQRFVAWPREARNPDLARGPFGSREDDPLHRAFREGRAALVHLYPARELWWEARWKEQGVQALDTLLRDLPVCWRGDLGVVYYRGNRDAHLCPHGEEMEP